jgi:hypothetical protein
MTSNYEEIQLKNKVKFTHYYFPQEKMLYSRYTSRRGHKYLKCVEKGCGCRGKIFNGVFKRTNEKVLHNHQDHENKASAERKLSELRMKVKATFTPIRAVHKKALLTTTRESGGRIAYSRCRRTLQRVRHDSMPVCKSMSDLINHLENDESLIFKAFGTLRSSRFYYGAVGDQPVFANADLIAGLPTLFNVFIDGTFNVQPFNAAQLLVVMGEVRGRPRPLAYVIMSGKTEAHYTSIFKFLDLAVFGFDDDGEKRQPISVSCDFEQAMRNAAKKIWPNAIRRGCNFHLGQAQRRKGRSIPKLSLKLKNGSKHQNILKMFMRLSLLPLDRVDAGFEAILQFIRLQSLMVDFKEFIAYFRHTWFGLFKKETWVVSDADRRTNNDCEGYNNKLKKIIPRNPTPWAFLEGLHYLAVDASSEYDSDGIRNAPPRPDRSLLSAPLTEALRELKDGTLNEFQFLEKMAKVSGKKKVTKVSGKKKVAKVTGKKKVAKVSGKKKISMKKRKPNKK